MVIQRIQSLLLLAATILMVVFIFCPITFLPGENGLTAVYVKSLPVYLTLAIVTAALLFISIFLYKNLRHQISVTRDAYVLEAACIFYPMLVGGSIEWISMIILAMAFLLTFFAVRAMCRDRQLLSSYDRLR